jgi:malate synthase
MTTIEIAQGLSFPQKFWTPEMKELFPDELITILSELHRELEGERQKLLQQRSERQLQYDAGQIPAYLDSNSEAVQGKWQVAPIPPELQCRRVEITGPVNSAKMVINMLNRNDVGVRADMAMLDFEDSMKPSFKNIIDGYKNVIAAVAGNLSYSTPGKIYQLNPSDMAYVMVRTRGLHLNETNIQMNDEAISGGLLDLTVCFFHTAKKYLEQNKTPKYYIPKCEHYLEARWWNRLFSRLEEKMGIKHGTLKATFLIETLPATFQVEEILYEIKDHAAGLNVGRWDKIFSDIKVLRNHPDRIMADRSSITMTRPWMENYAKRVIKICHDRGAFAMGGMAAFTPGKSEALREEQTRKVIEDKRREAEWGHDGCWVSHPYFIGIAMQAFQTTNQLHRKLENFDKYSEILPQGVGPYTLNGLRTNIRVGIAYMHGWLQDIGCVAFDNLMEDLATLEISRAQTWQWLHHQIILDDGTKVTKELVEHLFNEEFIKISQEWNAADDPLLSDQLIRAREESRKLFLNQELQEFLSLASDHV